MQASANVNKLAQKLAPYMSSFWRMRMSSCILLFSHCGAWERPSCHFSYLVFFVRFFYNLKICISTLFKNDHEFSDESCLVTQDVTYKKEVTVKDGVFLNCETFICLLTSWSRIWW